MKTCTRLADMKAGYERDIAFLRGHAARHEGSSAAKASTRHSWGMKQNMARALARHFERCALCQ